MNSRQKIKIIADDKIPFLKGVLEPFANVEYYPGKEITKEKTINADALIVRTRTKCNAELLEGTRVKVITTATIGFDHIDTEYCNKKKIKWLNAPGCNSTSVMQYITSVLLKLAETNNFNLSQKTIGIVGVGNVGSKIKIVAETLGMKVLLNDPPRKRNESNNVFCCLEKIINECDIITFHVPLNRTGIDKTFHLADEKFFEKLNNKQVIINSSRGEVVKTSALIKAIKSGKISNTVLDVWENEPSIDLELLSLVNYATPHIAGYSADGKANGTAVCANAISDFFNLGLTQNWYPESIPQADEGSDIIVNCKNKSDQEIISEAVFATYLVLNDSDKFKNNPNTFEKQRGDYPIRREFQNYKVTLNNCNSDVAEKIKKLGFQLSI